MTFEEFRTVVDDELMVSRRSGGGTFWFHFEGRIPDTTLTCMKYLGQIRFESMKRLDLRVSVELEKPGREGLQELAQLADVVFYSKSWAQGESYKSATDCLLQQSKVLGTAETSEAIVRTLICTWDKFGACALVMTSDKESEASDIVYSRALAVAESEIVDTVGAGDTFIAGMLYALSKQHSARSLKQKLDFANCLAGCKITQDGFAGLAKRSSLINI